METSISGANHAVLHAQITRRSLGLIETSISVANHDVLQAQSDRSWLGPIETCNTGDKAAVLNGKNHR